MIINNEVVEKEDETAPWTEPATDRARARRGRLTRSTEGDRGGVRRGRRGRGEEGEGYLVFLKWSL